MEKNFSERDLDILLGYQVGTIGYVFPRLRLVSIVLKKYPQTFFYVDGNLSEDDQETLSLIDLYAGTGLDWRIDQGGYEIIRVDYPHPIPDYLGECVYSRKEPLPQGPIEFPLIDDVNMDRMSKLRLALQRAMINRIFPQIRSIILSEEDSTIHIYITVDGEIAQEDRATLEEIGPCFSHQIPKNELKQYSLTIERLDFPQKEKGRGRKGCLEYLRKEYEANGSLHPYDVYGSLTPGIQKGLTETSAEKFLRHKDGGAFVLSFQKFAYCKIFPQLRLVSMVRNGFSFELHFYVDGEVSKSDQESIEELRSYFGEDLYRRVVQNTAAKVIRVDAPSTITYSGVCLFARKEALPLVHIKPSILAADIDFYYKVLLAMQWAMINRIFPRIRAIEIAIEDNSVDILVVVYEDISPDEKTTLEAMKTCFMEQLPKDEIGNCSLEIIQKPFSTDPLDSIEFLPEIVYYSKVNKRY